MAKFEGNVEGFRVTPNSALDANSIVQVGALLGVTRKNLAANETGIAYMTGTKSIYSLPLASGIAADIDRGTLATIDTGKVKPAGAGDKVIGVFWEDTDNAADEAVIMLSDLAVPVGAGLASDEAPGIVQTDGSTIDITSAGVISVHSS